jgi:uncharacterized protein YuzE
METAEINQIKNLLPWFIKHGKVWTDYDQEADVLYVHFKKPNHADNSEMTDDDIIFRYEKDEIIGISLLNASKKG